MSNKLGLVVFLDWKGNQDVYISILNKYLISFVEALNASDQIDLKFQQDNAYLHTVKRTKAWLAKIAEKHQLKIIEYPLNSSDMSQIEHL